MAVKDMGASVLSRLKKQAKEKGMNYQTCLQLFAQEEFLRKLEVSRYAENLILKGGMFLYTISNYEGRPTMDIDFMLRRMSNDVAGMKAAMEEIMSFVQNEYLQNLWKNYNPGPGLEKPDFPTVLEQIKYFLNPVYKAILREEEFFGMWSARESEWKQNRVLL